MDLSASPSVCRLCVQACAWIEIARFHGGFAVWPGWDNAVSSAPARTEHDRAGAAFLKSLPCLSPVRRAPQGS